MSRKFLWIAWIGLLGAGGEAYAVEPVRRITFSCPSAVAIDFTTQKIIRGMMATQVGAKITDAKLGSDSRIEIEIEVSEYRTDLPRPYRVLKMLYDPFQQHYVVSTPDIPIRNEGKTGGHQDPMYYVTVRVTPRSGQTYLLVRRTILDFVSAVEAGS